MKVAKLNIRTSLLVKFLFLCLLFGGSAASTHAQDSSFKDKINQTVGRELFVDPAEISETVHTWKDVKKWYPARGSDPLNIPYPENLRGSGKSEVITAYVIITPSGYVINPELENLKNKEFAIPAVLHLAGLRFQVPKIDGDPVYLRQKIKLTCKEDIGGSDAGKSSKEQLKPAPVKLQKDMNYGSGKLTGKTPNLIVIMADDLGYADVGFNGCKDIPTPNIDKVAAQGMRFSSAYVTYPVCGPSRAGFITGRYQQRFGFERNPQYRTDDSNMGLPLSEETIAKVLSRAGYTSGVIGKWHLGAHEELHPLNRGFDFFYGHLGGGHHYFPELLTIKDSYKAKNEGESYDTWILRNHQPEKTEKYLTHEFSDEAVKFIEENKDNPFFLFLSYNAPHTPMEAPENYLDKFKGIKNPKRRTYAAMVSAMDDGIGQVLEKLAELNLEKDTLVFFLSDNGGPTSANASNNKPLRGAKSDVWEGGWRVPFVLRWTGNVKAGEVYDKPVTSMDILGTIASITGAPLSKERPLDGVNLMPYLNGNNRGTPHEVIYLRKFDQQRYALRKGEFKLVIPEPNMTPRLFNLDEDISEKKNIADWQRKKVQELEELRLEWDAQLIEPRFLGLIHTNVWKKKPGDTDN